jgi:cyclic pyranopterin phosphate synthase
MNADGISWLNRNKILKYEEILEVVKEAAALGIDRIRLTGGEPLVRKSLSWLIRGIRGIPEIMDLSLTTNGILLEEQAFELKDAGLNRINISLDTLNPERYAQITRGGDIKKVWAGIKAAQKAGLDPIKINVVLLKSINDQDVLNLLNLAYEHPLHVRFIEYMPIGDDQNLNYAAHYLPLQFILEVAAIKNISLKLTDRLAGNGTAETYIIEGGKGTVGLIHPVSQHFCLTCNRLRLTADGMLKPCLYWQDELSVKEALGKPEKIRDIFKRAMELKHREHTMEIENASAHGMRCMSRTGG